MVRRARRNRRPLVCYLVLAAALGSVSATFVQKTIESQVGSQTPPPGTETRLFELARFVEWANRGRDIAKAVTKAVDLVQHPHVKSAWRAYESTHFNSSLAASWALIESTVANVSMTSYMQMRLNAGLKPGQNLTPEQESCLAGRVAVESVRELLKRVLVSWLQNFFAEGLFVQISKAVHQISKQVYSELCSRVVIWGSELLIDRLSVAVLLRVAAYIQTFIWKTASPIMSLTVDQLLDVGGTQLPIITSRLKQVFSGAVDDLNRWLWAESLAKALTARIKPYLVSYVKRVWPRVFNKMWAGFPWFRYPAQGFADLCMVGLRYVLWQRVQDFLFRPASELVQAIFAMSKPLRRLAAIEDEDLERAACAVGGYIPTGLVGRFVRGLDVELDVPRAGQHPHDGQTLQYHGQLQVQSDVSIAGLIPVKSHSYAFDVEAEYVYHDAFFQEGKWLLNRPSDEDPYAEARSEFVCSFLVLVVHVSLVLFVGARIVEAQTKAWRWYRGRPRMRAILAWFWGLRRRVRARAARLGLPFYLALMDEFWRRPADYVDLPGPAVTFELGLWHVAFVVVALAVLGPPAMRFLDDARL